jgi:hypothetical protein
MKSGVSTRARNQLRLPAAPPRPAASHAADSTRCRSRPHVHRRGAEASNRSDRHRQSSHDYLPCLDPQWRRTRRSLAQGGQRSPEAQFSDAVRCAGSPGASAFKTWSGVIPHVRIVCGLNRGDRAGRARIHEQHIERDEQRGPLVRVASSRALLGGRALHADAFESVPTSYLPTGGLVDSLDARVDDPSARCAVRRGDDFPLPRLVNEPVANLKLRRQDAAPGRRCWFALLLWSRSSHRLAFHRA